MKRIICSAFLLLACSGKVFADGQYGISMGSPGGINFVAKKEVAGMPLQFSVGHSIFYYGAEAGYQFYRNESGPFRSVQFVAGATRENHILINFGEDSDLEVSTWNYVGLSTTLEIGRFYIEPGISFGTGDYSSPRGLLQIGRLW